MSSGVSSAVKNCVKCGRDVAGAKRMKDSEGKYWCIPCGQADQKKRLLSMGGVCSGCGESISASKLTEIGGLPYCDKCLKKRYANSGPGLMSNIKGLMDLSRWMPSGGGGGDEGTGKRKVLMIAAVVILAAAAYYINFM